jgi:hypothetical protein
MPKVIFRGENASGYTRCWGYTFPTGEEVEVDDAAVKQAETHPEFDVVAEKPAKAENPPAEAISEAEAPAPAKKPRKPRKAAKKA